MRCYKLQGNYYIKDFLPDYEKFPNNLKAGKYMMALNFTDKGHLYAEVK